MLQHSPPGLMEEQYEITHLKPTRDALFADLQADDAIADNLDSQAN